MLMGFGPYRFAVPNFSVESFGRRASGRIAQQEVIGAEPITHLLGPGTSQVTMSSTFHPLHMNRGGEFLLAALEALVRAQVPHILISISGTPFGRWILTEVGSDHSLFMWNGRAQTIKVDLTLEKYGGAQGGRLGIF